MTDYEISKGRTYMYLPADKPATYPFGFGLSYTQFTYANLHLSPIAQKSLTLSIDITNTGSRDGDEIPQLYVRKTQSTITRPIKQLKGFQRLTIAKGQTKTVTFTLPFSELAIWDEPSKSFLVEPGTYEVLLGASSQDIRARQTFQVP
jgi:beta-glucosidase